MTYAVISQWTSSVDRSAEAGKNNEKTAQNKFVPSLKALGAVHAYFMYTGDTTFNVITIYPDEATATAAIAKQNAIRSQAAADMPVRLVGELRGEVFASL
jgi:hypothetical protein